MNINRDTQVKKTNHAGPINAIPPVLWMQAAIITLGAFATMLSSTMLSAALPTMANGLGVTDASIQWIATAYLMALAAGVPVSAWAVKRFGATQLWLYALILFGVFSAVCALSPNVEVLLTARIMQGLAGGLLVPAGRRSRSGGRSRAPRADHWYDRRGYRHCALTGNVSGAVLLQVCGWRVLFLLMSPYLSVPGLRDGNYSSPDNKNDKPLSGLDGVNTDSL